jgi:hypothetical protein
MDPPRRRRRVGKVTFQPKKDTGVVAGRLMPAAHGKDGWLQCAAGERGALEVSAARVGTLVARPPRASSECRWVL